MEGDVGESSADETNNLVLSESHPDSSGHKKRYVVLGGGLKKGRCSRNEWICIVMGVVIVVIGLMVLLGVAVGTWVGVSRSSSDSSEKPWENVRLPSSITPEGVYLFSLFTSLSLPHLISPPLSPTVSFFFSLSLPPSLPLSLSLISPLSHTYTTRNAHNSLLNPKNLM